MMNDLELFSEIYGCYFTVIGSILEQAQNGAGLNKAEIEKLVQNNAFYDSAFHLLPKLFSGEWDLLDKKGDDRYYSKIQMPNIKRPMSALEKAWIKALLLDKRISLFVSPDELKALEMELSHIQPIFLPSDFHIFDSAADGDPYLDEQYKQVFRAILHACLAKTALFIVYESGKQRRLTKHVFPHKLCYSNRDDKFRLMGILIQKGEHYKCITLNLARILSVEPSDKVFQKEWHVEEHVTKHICAEPIVLELSKERNALERCMLQFASWEKQTEYDENKNCYICRIFYDGQDETELLIRILSFGPVVKVLGPEGFLMQVKERIKKQSVMNGDFQQRLSENA